ncbi:MAG: alpha/beta hydrolase [Gammaproteobacteria bacterium]|nr:alpha/beta hydrolase [Gammaproteobacteria bacterium]
MLAHAKYSGRGGVPLVMIHGFLCCGKFFAPNIRVISEFADVITIDLPGFGESFAARAAGSVSEMAARTLGALDALGCERFDLLGHSMGGMVALQIALDAPARARKLILFATNSDGNLPERFETFAESKTRLRARGMESARKEIVATWFMDGAAHPRYADCLACSDRVGMPAALAALRAMENFNLTARLAEISMPTLVIGACRDRTYAPRRLREMRRAIPGAQLHFMKDCAHNAHLEDEKTFNKLVLDFVRPGA